MNVEQLARYIVAKCETDRDPVTVCRLNFMLYFLRDKFGEAFHEKLFEEKEIYGPRPSFHSVYMKYKQYGALPIQIHLDPEAWDEVIKNTKKELSEEEFQFLNQMIEHYRKTEMYFLYKEYDATTLKSWLIS